MNIDTRHETENREGLPTLAIEDILNLAIGLVLIALSLFYILVSSLLTVKAKRLAIPLAKGMNSLQWTSYLLGLFLLSHGLYHLVQNSQFDFLSDNFFEPVSVAFLLALALHVRRTISVSQKKQVVKPTQIILLIIAAPLILIPYDLLNPFELFTLSGIVFSSVLFARMAVSSPSIRTMQFQLGIITLVWASAEIPHVFASLGLLNVSPVEAYGLTAHLISMLLVGIMATYRAVFVALPHAKRVLSSKGVGKT